jgi:hypothetical protein
MNPIHARSRPLAFMLAVGGLLLLAGNRVHAQPADRKACAVDSTRMEVIDVADHSMTRVRTGQLTGDVTLSSLMIRRPSLERAAGSCAGMGAGNAPAVAALPLRVRTTFNSAYPVDVNNGALWAGRGIGFAVSGGGEVRLGPFSAAAHPLVAYHQNRAFPLKHTGMADRSPYAYAGNHGIDWPQRHGAGDFMTLDPGQSYARLEGFGATVGVSTENIWLGPAQRMPLIMGSSAPGFPHIFLGTARPVDVRIGSLEALAFWGRLKESDYFDQDPDNDRTLIAGVSVAFEPAFARGLFIGVNRMYLADMEGGDLTRYFIDPYVNVRDNPIGDNQLFSLFARWVLPRSGFEVYAEWAREDHWGDWIDLLREPDHSQAYMLGFQKMGRLGDARLRWHGELAHLTASTTLRSGRGVVSFYTHSEVIQGYTNRGQLLGAWTGPGSDGQVLGVERLTPRRTTGLMLERVRYDADAYYNQWARFYGQNGHDVSIGLSIRHIEYAGPVSVHAGLGAARRHNRSFVHLEGQQPPDFRAETNLQLDLDLRWTPRIQ